MVRNDHFKGHITIEANKVRYIYIYINYHRSKHSEIYIQILSFAGMSLG